MGHAGVVIVGSGAAGASAAGTLRRSGYPGRIVVVRGEPHRPYNRTTVNKALLQGLVSVDAVTLPEADAQDVEWADVDVAVALDTTARTITLASGRSLTYENLIIATGVTAHTFPGEATPAVRERMLTLRTAGDTSRLRRWIADGDRDDPGRAGVTILGAGLIGAETSAVLTAAGVPVHLVSSSVAPLNRRLGRITGESLAALHERHVQTHFGQTITRAHLDGSDQVVATLTDGARINSGTLLVSIGVSPDPCWLNGSGLETSDGVAVDQRLRARGADDVYAAGDVARMTDEAGRGYRIEHWSHAVAQGRHAALALLHDSGEGADPGAFDETPSYSMRLYGTRVTIVGQPVSFAGEALIRGDVQHGQFTVALTDVGQRLVGAVGVGDVRLANALRPAVHANEPLDAALALAQGL